MLNAKFHGIRARAWPTGEEKERGVEKKVRQRYNAAVRQ